MRCDEFMSLLPMYPDALGDLRVASALRQHAAECAECASRLQEQEILLSTLNTLDEGLSMPEAFSEGWRNAVRLEGAPPRKTRMRRLKALALTAAAVLAVVGGTALMREGMLFPSSGMDRQTAYQSSVIMATEAAPQSSFLAADTAPLQMDQAYPPEPVMMFEESGGADLSGGESPVVLHSAYIALSTEQYDADVAQIDQLVTTYGGWSEYWSVYGEPIADNPESGRFASMTLRVPVESLQQMLSALAGIGITTSTEVTAEDISDSYYDTQGRLAMYEAQRARLEALMSEADSMTDIIEIDGRLSELQYTIETLIGRLNNWNASADNAVVRLSVTEVAPGGARAGDTVWQRMKNGWAASLHTGEVFALDMLVFLVTIAPFALGVLALGAVAVFIWNRTKQRESKRSARE